MAFPAGDEYHGVIVTTVLAVTLGVVASWDVIVRKPATILREDEAG